CLFSLSFPGAGHSAPGPSARGRGPASPTVSRPLPPATRAVMRGDMRGGADGAARGRGRAREALDLIAGTAGTDGYLVGEQFSVADLTAAALLSVTVFPPECPARVPEPRAPGLRSWLARWADHPAIARASRMYARYLGVSVDA